MVTSSTCTQKDTLLRLWVHEALRVFHDRLICIEDREMFKKMTSELVNKHFPTPITHAELFEDRTIMFGDFMKPGLDREERQYEELLHVDKVIAVLEDQLEEYNM